MTRRIRLRAFGATTASFVLLACGGSDAPETADTGSGNPSGTGELTAVELEQGIGPIRDLELGALDPALVAEGEVAFVTKCSACHKVEERYVGPRMGTVLSRRSPEFVMNMILNANEMVLRHPVVQEMLAQFYTPMPVQVTNPDEARAILEYLRDIQMDSIPTPTGASGS